jgi:hypothetical protein
MADGTDGTDRTDRTGRTDGACGFGGAPGKSQGKPLPGWLISHS